MPPDYVDTLGARRSRTELILVAAIALVALLVVAMLSEFSEQRQLHARTLNTVATARNVRDDAVAIMQALTDVKATRLLIAEGATPALRADAEAAMHATRTQVATLQRHSADDAELAAASARIGALIEQDFALPDQLSAAEHAAHSITFRAELRAAMSDLHARVNAINDVAREAERGAREQIDVTAIALAVMALFAAGLAALAVRGERQRWREARDAAEFARASAAEADAAKSRFLAVASHDMRQPLHALTLYLAALERRVETQEARDILQKMERATQSMTGMFSTLLDLARVQAGAVAPEIDDVRVQDMFDRIAAEHPGGQVDVRATALNISTDPMLFERALSNLVANAMKHGGGACRIEASASGEFVDISVVDDGPGIPLDDQDRIFDEFVRLETRGGDGLGLGLAIVKRIARLLDTPLSLSSTPGEGARFTLRARGAHVANGATPSSAAAHSIAGVKVLLLDDDALAREAVAGVLRDLGGAVHSCASEADVVAALDAGLTPDLLVMDLRIDGALKGLDVARRARARFPSPPPTIIITGDTGPETLAMLRASGFAWLIKPVDPDRLMQAVAAQLGVAA